MEIITKKLNYFENRHNSSVLKYTECVDKFSTNYESEISLKTKTPIFLDTNILLRYYSISFVARKKLFDFIKKNYERIIITKQVQFEFLKNRENVIQKYFEQVTNKIPKDFNSDIVNKLNSFLETHRTVLKDYPFVETGITKHQNELEKLLEKLNKNSEQKRKDNINLIIKDDFLDLLKTCILYEGLNKKEIDLVKTDFDTLKDIIKSENIDSILKKPNEVFPGLGDIKEKPSDPYGDYIIFHEMIKYSVENKVDVIFLTFDNTKGDWMSKSKTQYIHYIQNFYSNTEQLIYILDAERSLEEILKINIQSLVSIKETDLEDDIITILSLTEFIETNSTLASAKSGIVRQKLITELKQAGYSTISEIEKDFTMAEIAFEEFNTTNSTNFNSIGILRLTLQIANPNYRYSVDNKGRITERKNIMGLEKYRKFLL
jgi:predicted nucleic acid-binding protein|tara:strand:+ start:2147 stop:3442 length:1296 start_codon:yes stop_codon:yes gene_type:complete